MKYVIPFTDDLDERDEAITAEVIEKLATSRYTSPSESLQVIDRLYEVIEGLRQHNTELEEELKEVYQNE